MKKSFFIGMFLLLGIRGHAQQSTYINIQHVGISPPTYESTLIMLDSNIYYDEYDTFKKYIMTDPYTFHHMITFVETYHYGKQLVYASSFGAFTITIGIVRNHKPIVQKKFVLSDTTISKSFFKTLYKELIDKDLDKRLCRQINYYITKYP
jgi:hypothetical protein